MEKIRKAISNLKYKDLQQTTVFSRDTGAICYEAEIFDPSSVAELPELLLASGLDWLWNSSPAYGIGPERPATLLNLETAPLLTADLLERDIDDNGKGVLIFGSDPGTATLLLDSDSRYQAVKLFASTEQGPLRIVLFQEPDSSRCYIYVSHYPTQQVVRLLHHWDIIQANIRKTRPYGQLYTVQLEQLFGL